MDISLYFTPLPQELEPVRRPLDPYTLGDYTKGHFDEFPLISEADIIIMGCPEDKGAKEINGCAMAPNLIRRHLYKLAVPRGDVRIADLGNMRHAERMVNYYDAIAEIVWEITRRGKTLIILGGSQDIAYGQYLGYRHSQRKVEYTCIDSRLDVEDSDFGINNHSYNHKIFVHSPNYLFNFTNLGNQGHFVSANDLKKLKNLNFPAVRLGKLREDLREAEPYLRTSDMVSIDMSAVRSSDAPGSSNPSPAGFTTEEICQLSWYAGMSDSVSSISFCEAHPMKDFNEQTTLLTSLMIWYFIDGVYNRKDEMPPNEEAMAKHTVSLLGGAYEIEFFRNDLTDRWWMKVPYANAIGKPDGKYKLVACSETDFQKARHDEIPDRWWITHNKLH
ncbi:MAG: formimidoylglutamase [Bacteroidia bacterium]|nr:formimidoylglutamase [Bacteroidia bacterium]